VAARPGAEKNMPADGTRLLRGRELSSPRLEATTALLDLWAREESQLDISLQGLPNTTQDHLASVRFRVLNIPSQIQ
jgi:hypothetical protein